MSPTKPNSDHKKRERETEISFSVVAPHKIISQTFWQVVGNRLLARCPHTLHIPLKRNFNYTFCVNWSFGKALQHIFCKYPKLPTMGMSHDLSFSLFCFLFFCLLVCFGFWFLLQK